MKDSWRQSIATEAEERIFEILENPDRLYAQGDLAYEQERLRNILKTTNRQTLLEWTLGIFLTVLFWQAIDEFWVLNYYLGRGNILSEILQCASLFFAALLADGVKRMIREKRLDKYSRALEARLHNSNKVR